MRAIRLMAVFLVIVTAVAGCRTATGKTAGETVDDAKITAAVKTKLVADKAANLTRIDVDTNNGIVYLNGTVETAEHKARAEELAKGASGVRRVVNNLQVQRR
jgi:hyperosmotically inducible protein